MGVQTGSGKAGYRAGLQGKRGSQEPAHPRQHAEPTRDLDIKIKYIDKNGQQVEEAVEQFFPSNDRSLVWHSFKVNVLQPDDVFYFHFVNKESVPSGRATVIAKFIDAKSLKKVEMSKEFDLIQ